MADLILFFFINIITIIITIMYFFCACTPRFLLKISSNGDQEIFNHLPKNHHISLN